MTVLRYSFLFFIIRLITVQYYQKLPKPESNCPDKQLTFQRITLTRIPFPVKTDLPDIIHWRLFPRKPGMPDTMHQRLFE